MSDNQTVTEREAVLRERRAWDECAYRLSLVGMGSAESEQLKNELYPLPTITRPRVVKDPEDAMAEWQVVDGDIRLVCHRGGGPQRFRLSSERIRLWADLLANPTEEVDG